MQQKHYRKKRKIVSLLNDRRFKQKHEEENLRILGNFLATAEKPERIQQRITVLQEKYKQTYASTFDETALNAIQNEKFDPESAICPTCGQALPEEQVERLKTEFEQKKQERIHAEFAKKSSLKQTNSRNLKTLQKKAIPK